MARSIQKAVIPVAGLGTRFLPVTKSVPKELLPVVSKPTIQFALEEVAAAGIREIILVIGPGKEMVRNYLEPHTDYTHILQQHQKGGLLEELNTLLQQIHIRYVWQEEQLGLGHAVACAKGAVGEEPFLILLPDMIIDSTPTPTETLIRVYQETGKSAIMVHPVLPADLPKYGILRVKKSHSSWHEVGGLVEKPDPAEAPSNLAVTGRYLVEPAIFELIRSLPATDGSEIQITDALTQLAATAGLLAVESAEPEQIFDTGTPEGLIAANLHFQSKVK